MPMSDHFAEIRALVGTRLLGLASVTGIIRNAEGDILLVRNSGASQWTTPGGMIEPLERPSYAVVRELKEELNIEVKPIKMVGVFSGPEYAITYPHGDEVVFITSVFECEIVSGSPTPDLDELEACQYFSKAQLTDLNMPEWMIDLLTNLENGVTFN